mgnify:FL=1
MPAISQYDPQRKAFRVLADDELHQRRSKIAKNRAYYDGDHPHQLTDTRDNITLNLCKQAIDQTVSFLIPSMPNFELNDQPNRNDRETWLMTCWERNGGASLVHQMALNGALAGHVFARIIPNKPYPRIVPLNPANVIVWWRADDFQTILGYEVRWEAPEGRYRQDVYKEGNIWIVRDYAQPHPTKRRGLTSSYDWELVIETRLKYPPIISWGHLPALNHHYGRDELGDLLNLNIHINKVASDIKSILRYHAYPTTVGTGFSAKDVQETRIDGFLTIPDKEARVFNVEMQSDLSSSLALLDRLEAHFLGISRVVMMRPDADAFRGMTNLGIRTAYLPMLMKNEQLRRAYSHGLRQLCEVLLTFCPHPAPDADESVRVFWADPLPKDRAEQVELVLKELDANLIDTDTAQSRLR